MPLEGFYCPDKKQVLIGDCFKCLSRCHSLAYLSAAGDSRKWNGKPSTTQLLNGTRMEYLKITKPYYILPDDRAFAILGTWSHSKLDFFADKAGLITVLYLDGEIPGILDKLEPDPNNNGFWHLIDHKTWGAYSVSKALSGKDDDMFGYSMQLNNYRINVENNEKIAEKLGQKIKISKMFIEAIIRDGGTYTAKSMDLFRRTAIIPVPHLPDIEVAEYFHTKRQALLTALDSETMPGPCDKLESWNWRRCKGYCEVSQYCPEGQKINGRKVS